MPSKELFKNKMEQVLAQRVKLTDLSHPVFERLIQQKEIEFLRYVALQGYQLTKEFAKYVAGLIHFCPLQELRPIMATNLYEEETGKLSKTKNHLELMHQFLEGLGISPEQREAAKALPTTRDLIEYRWNLINPTMFHQGAAAVLIASEGQNLDKKGQKSRHMLMKEIYGLTDHHLEFFTVHADEDVYHVQDGLNIVSEVCTDEQMQQEALDAICLTCHKFRSMYDGILAEYDAVS